VTKICGSQRHRPTAQSPSQTLPQLLPFLHFTPTTPMLYPMVDYAQSGTSFYGFNSKALSLSNMLIMLQSSAARLGLEEVIWVTALLFLAFQDPYSTTHLSLFWPSWFFDIQSPGYNLGHSISFLFRANISDSVQAHYLGIPTTTVLMARVITLLKQPAVTQKR